MSTHFSSLTRRRRRGRRRRRLRRLRLRMCACLTMSFAPSSGASDRDFFHASSCVAKRSAQSQYVEHVRVLVFFCFWERHS